ncbi:uncharacterized protein EAF02_005932 [Botrytis sinoallii]|uniref:uncharacterized protein n=1 Tax=Botrytis sinoallii TaxID=1463999 RepID=UPI001901F037|nr:uncharacterized protein EAF02_005932 [Botrytis sinoallii]KAF7882569.1 hypothetical protein EAF02_005932 [Botrytis sinoallii]
MTSHTSHHRNESSLAIPSDIPVELQSFDNPHQNHKTSYPLTNSNVENLESANVTDIIADAGRVGEGIRSTSDTEAVLQAEDPERVYQQLKPVDGGPAAWRLLIAAFVFEAILWGFPISFGVFQDYYFTLPQFANSKSQIALSETISQGLCYLGAPLSASLTKRFPKHQAHQIWFGLPICILGLVAGSFCDSVQGLIWTQGVRVYLPSFATNIGLAGTQGAAILAVMSVAQVAGQFACGYLSDKNFSVNALAVGCTIMATISSLLLWGFAKSMDLLIAYGIV